MSTTNERNISTVIHLSTLTQYFIPFGNYIFPIILWSSKKTESEFVDYNGKQVLNFQLSMLLYSLILCLIAIPIIVYSVLKHVTWEDIMNDNHHHLHELTIGQSTGFIMLGLCAAAVFGFLKIMEFVLIIYASVKASNGERYKYPLSIPFFK